MFLLNDLKSMCLLVIIVIFLYDDCWGDINI